MKMDGYINKIIKNKFRSRLAYFILLFFVLLGLIAPLLSNERPLWVHDGDRVYWPMFSSLNWERICSEKSCRKIFAPIPFSPQSVDMSAPQKKPGAISPDTKRRHLLGTDDYGRDVLAILIHGSRTAIWISMLAVGLAFLVGMFFGLIMGYYGRDRVYASYIQILFSALAAGLAIGALIFIKNLYAAGMTSLLFSIMMPVMGSVE